MHNWSTEVLPTGRAWIAGRTQPAARYRVMVWLVDGEGWHASALALTGHHVEKGEFASPELSAAGLEACLAWLDAFIAQHGLPAFDLDEARADLLQEL